MHRLLSLASCLSIALLAPSMAAETDAPVVEGNPDGAQYIANIRKNGLVAEIVAETPLNGRGVSFSIKMDGNTILNSAEYIYHLHELPVPEDGNCTATKAHLDPYKRGEDPICDASNPASCQVGDLSGKHGNIPYLPGFGANYTDDYVSLIPGTGAFMGDKSFVLHFANKTRIACANFKLVQKDSSEPINGTTISGSGSNSTATSSHGTHIPTATSATDGSDVPEAEGAAGKTATVPRGAMIGPLVFGVAAAVW